MLTVVDRLLTTIGVALQFVGVALVFLQVARSQAALGQITWLVAFRQAVFRPYRRLLLKLDIIKSQTIAAKAASAAMSSGSATVRARVTRSRTGDANQQITGLWASLDDLQRDLEERSADINQRIISVQQKLAADCESTTKAVNRLRDQVGAIGAGSAKLQLAGAIFILLGVALLGAAGWIGA